MKKFYSISVSILMLAAMLHLTVATHYCNGKETARRVSLTGRLAGCGMEGLEKELPRLPGANFTRQCCKDVVNICGTDSNYAPSFSFVPESFQSDFQIFAIPIGLSVNSFAYNISLYANVSPPWVLMSTNVDLSDICVFRI